MPSFCIVSLAASFGVLAPFVEIGSGAAAVEAEDGALGRNGALAELPELVLFIKGAIIGGLGIEGPFVRPCPKLGLVTSGLGLSGPEPVAVVLTAC